MYPPHVLREYALLADGERGALIGPRGEVAWLCVPRWDSDAVFSALIGGAGIYAVSPVGRYVWGGYYEDGTLIWRSRWITETGIIECREALAFPAEPGRVVLLRRIHAVQGDAHLRVLLDPRPGFGRHQLSAPSLDDDGIWTGRAGPTWLRWSGAGAARPGGGDGGEHTLGMELTVPAGGHHDLVLEMADAGLRNRPVDAAEAWKGTEHTWRTTLPAMSDTIAPRDARHAYAVLRGLTSSSGGMVAATTTSLPERAEQGENYDYRYVWIRDQCFAGQAAAAVGADPLLDDAVRFVAARVREDGQKLRPAYTITGGPIPEQRTLNLPGYPGGQDVVGNPAGRQFQLDAFGEMLLLFAAAARRDRLDADGWRAVEAAVAAIRGHWSDPEAGLWELDDRFWTESRLICVAGLRAVSSLGAPAPRTTEWLALADKISARTSATCLHPSGRWQRAQDDARVDAALLMPAVRGALPVDDPRTVATLRALQEELSEDFYLYRFRHQPGPLGQAEGAFLLCGFVMALACHQQGDTAAALRWFERNRASCGPPGLFSEEFDVTQRQLRGNLPQAFVHALMLEASARLARPWSDQ